MRRVAIRVRGVVQGVGFRPFVYNLARSLGVAGWIRNEADAVRIEAQGTGSSLEAFLGRLRVGPAQARVESVEVEEIACQPSASFEIEKSAGESSPRPAIPADLATCDECRAEIRTPGERRFAYPFTNCTHCGPRWSIIRALPYDRPRTSMAGFPLCEACQAQYENPADRRFHAQPIACPVCGPKLRLIPDDVAQPLEAAAALIATRKILALQGLGGFQLLVDATNESAVQRLRDRKRRPHKPLAVLFPSLDSVRRSCVVSANEAAEMESPQSPIVLLRRRADSREIADSVAPGNPYLGAMLPYTPLHHLLIEAIGRPIVCTSGNLSEEPMAIEIDDARQRLGNIVDAFLVHDRPIVRPVDDSVVQFLAPGERQMLRRARGFAPLPIEIKQKAAGRNAVLAVGGHLKNTVALSIGSQAVVSPHVGDLDNRLSVEVHRRAIEDLVSFFRAVPDAVACDLHPDYASTRVAEGWAAKLGVPLIRVQHHHAHAAAVMAEHGLAGPVLAFAWDGTGFGLDGTVWGAEALRCEGSQFSRVGSIRPFRLPGGDRAVREPRRSALGLLWELDPDLARQLAPQWFSAAELKSLAAMLERGLQSPLATSIGRLFDAVSALCHLGTSASFEGQAAMALQFAADENCDVAYPMPIVDGRGDWGPMVRAILADLAAGQPIGRISARFHNALADWAVATARQVGLPQVILSGGCFQNALLTNRVRNALLKDEFEVFLPRQVPPGDGGIALGQIAVALWE